MTSPPHPTPGPRQAPIVIKIGGTGVENPAATPRLWDAVSALNRSHRASGGAGVILVHGGGKAVDMLLSRLGFATERRQGLRVTPPEQMAIIAAALTGINKGIVASLTARGQPALGLCPGECATAAVRRHTLDGVDIGLVGEIAGGDPAFIVQTLERGIVPVFSPVGIDHETGGLLNINADDAAAGLAAVVNASLLVLLTDVPAVLGHDGKPIQYADAEELEALIARGVIHGGMVPKVRAAVRAASLSGADTLITSWQAPETIASIHEQPGIGTCVRPAHAQPLDRTDAARPNAGKGIHR